MGVFNTRGASKVIDTFLKKKDRQEKEYRSRGEKGQMRRRRNYIIFFKI